MAIEFWTTCADVEYHIYTTQTSKLPKNGFTDRAAAGFLNLFLQCLTSQDITEYDSDEWTLRKAGACSLESISRIIQNQIVENNAVKQFIQRYYNTNKWHIKEALINLVGTIIDGPNEDIILNFITTSLNGNNPNLNLLMLVAHGLKDENEHVKTSSTWAFAKLCVFCPKGVSLLGTDAIVRELGLLLVSSSPKQTSNACWALTQMVEFWYNKRDNNNNNNNNNSSNKPNINNNNNNNNNNNKISQELMQQLVGAVFERIRSESDGNTSQSDYESSGREDTQDTHEDSSPNINFSDRYNRTNRALSGIPDRLKVNINDLIEVTGDITPSHYILARFWFVKKNIYFVSFLLIFFYFFHYFCIV